MPCFGRDAPGLTRPAFIVDNIEQHTLEIALANTPICSLELLCAICKPPPRKSRRRRRGYLLFSDKLFCSVSPLMNPSSPPWPSACSGSAGSRTGAPRAGGRILRTGTRPASPATSPRAARSSSGGAVAAPPPGPPRRGRRGRPRPGPSAASPPRRPRTTRGRRTRRTPGRRTRTRPSRRGSRSPPRTGRSSPGGGPRRRTAPRT